MRILTSPRIPPHAATVTAGRDSGDDFRHRDGLRNAIRHVFHPPDALVNGAIKVVEERQQARAGVSIRTEAADVIGAGPFGSRVGPKAANRVVRRAGVASDFGIIEIRIGERCRTGGRKDRIQFREKTLLLDPGQKLHPEGHPYVAGTAQART